MTDKAKEAAVKAVEAFLAPKPPVPSLKERFKDPARWKKSFKDIGLWFVYGVVITTMLSKFSPGYPIVVGTNSIEPGLYWLDREAFSFARDDYVSFPFKPTQAWLRDRYGDDRIFTKMVKAVQGDTVYADAQLRLKVCHADPLGGGKQFCEDVGVPQLVDGKGRTLTPWVPANHQYTLRAGELWVYGSNVRSLDSRYYGPIKESSVAGKATPLFLWK